MRLEKDDPRVIDYALGELEEDEQREIEAALALPENAEARAEAEAMRQAAGLARTALSAEADSGEAGLTEFQRKQVMKQASPPRGRRFLPWAIPLAAAAALLVLVAPRVMEETGMDVYREAAHREQAEALGYRSSTAETSGQAAQYAGDLMLEEEAPALGVRSAPPAPASQELHQKGAPVRSMADEDADGAGANAAPKMATEPPPPPATPAPQAAAQPRSAPAAGYPIERGNGQANHFFDSGQAGEQRDSYGIAAEEAPVPATSAVLVAPHLLRDVYWNMQPSAEGYAPIVENDFEQAASNPLSTFSIDVDTASYSNVRRFLNRGTLPPPNAVRIEELVNYFDYNYPAPEGNSPFAVHTELGPCPWQPEHLLVKIGLKGKEVERAERPAGNLVFLIDVSGSMNQPNKLPLVRESMKVLLEELDERDRVGIVTYSGQAAVALPSTPCSEKETIRAAIDSLGAGGSTHGSAGIRQAYAMAAQHFVPGGINRVVLATDGDFNVGVTNNSELHQLIQEKAKTKVFLTALGFGMGNIKDDRLELLADKGNGNYAYIDTFAEARRVLVEQLTGTLLTIAKDVKIQVEFNPAVVGAYRLIGYENRVMAARDFNDDAKDAGEIGAGHTVTALYQVAPAGTSPQPGVDPLKYQPTEQPESATEHQGEAMTVKLRYKHPEGDQSVKMEFPVMTEAPSLEATSDGFRHAAAVAAFGMLLRQSEHKGQATWDQVIALAREAKNNDPERQAFVDLAVTAKTLQPR